MARDFYNHEAKYYPLSDKITVFPCAYRDHGIDPEARLNSEKSLSGIGGINGGNTNYIAKYESLNNSGEYNLTVILNGYVFTLNDIKLDDLITELNGTVYVTIKLDTYDLTADKQSYKLASWYITDTGESSTTSNQLLDIPMASSETKYFTGIAFSGTPLTESQTTSYHIKLYEDGKFVNRNILPLNITNGKADNSLVLNAISDLDDESYNNTNLTLGNFSIASGKKTIALGEASFASGMGALTDNVITFGARQGELPTPYTYKYTNLDQDKIKAGKILKVVISDKDYYLLVTSIDTLLKQISFMSLTPSFPAGALGTEKLVEGIAAANYSHAEGQRTTASGESSHAEGFQTTASGFNSHAEGYLTTASSNYSHSEGWLTAASGNVSHAEGWSTNASGISSHAEGQRTIASGESSHAEGWQTYASKEAAHAEGYATIASGQYSHAEGLGNGIDNGIASGKYSHSEGQHTIASGNASHAEGYLTTASNSYAHAEGQRTTASGESSHAEGFQTTASGFNSHAEGWFATASGSYSHAEGWLTTASENASHAEGFNTNASASYSHAEGLWTAASGQCSHAEGDHTTANHKSQHVFGEYNVADTSTAATTAHGNYIEIVGNGDSSTRKNARVLDWNGNEWLHGGLYIGDTSAALGTSHTEKLYVNGSSYFGGSLSCTNAVNIGAFISSTSIALAVGTSGITNKLKVYGSGDVEANSYTAKSDKRLKENIVLYKSEKSILDLPVYKFDFINGSKNRIGCLAQDLQEICPEIVHECADGYLSIEEDKLVYLLLNEVKKLKAEVESLKNDTRK